MKASTRMDGIPKFGCRKQDFHLKILKNDANKNGHTNHKWQGELPIFLSEILNR